MSIDNMIIEIIKREGGYVNHKADKGGPTKYGITLKTLSEARGYEVTAKDVEKMPLHEAKAIYRQEYVVGPNFDKIKSPPLQELVVDCAVLHGQSRAALWLQHAADVRVVDGIVGPKTLRAVNSKPPGFLYRHVLSMRIQFFGALITKDPSQAVFAKGWLKRVAEFMEKTP